MFSCLKQCTHETPYYFASSVIMYMSGLTWLLYSLYLESPGLNAKDGVNHTWPYEYPMWECPFPLLIVITISQIFCGGITMVFPILKYQPFVLLSEYVWIQIAIFVTQAPPTIIIIHIVTYNLAIIISCIDYIKYIIKEKDEEERKRLESDTLVNHHVNHHMNHRVNHHVNDGNAFRQVML